MKTTLNKIRKHEPCADGWEKLLKHLGKTKADDEPLLITTILDSNGLDDAIWCLRAVAGRDREIRLFAVWCVRQVQHLLTDKRSIDALDVAERYANGDATDAELTAAADAAWAAASDAELTAAWAAASDAAWSAASDAVWAAARAARAAAYNAADAVWAAADAVWAAAEGARAAARAAALDATWAAAHQEMRSRQEVELRRICEEG